MEVHCPLFAVTLVLTEFDAVSFSYLTLWYLENMLLFFPHTFFLDIKQKQCFVPYSFKLFLISSQLNAIILFYLFICL